MNNGRKIRVALAAFKVNAGIYEKQLLYVSGSSYPTGHHYKII
jgi:hypothetical protein